MAVGYDSNSHNASGFVTGNQNWTHTPVGTLRGVLVYIIGDGNTDQITSVTYGGVAMTEASGSPLARGGIEPGIAHAFFLGSSIPAGAQTVAITTSGSTVNHSVTAFGVTASTDTAIENTNTGINSTSSTNPSATLTIANDSWISIGFNSGQDAISGITPLTGWTSRFEDSTGTESSGYYTKDANSAVDVTVGWTQSANDATAIAVGIKESSGTTTSTSSSTSTSFSTSSTSTSISTSSTSRSTSTSFSTSSTSSSTSISTSSTSQSTSTSISTSSTSSSTSISTSTTASITTSTSSTSTSSTSSSTSTSTVLTDINVRLSGYIYKQRPIMRPMKRRLRR